LAEVRQPNTHEDWRGKKEKKATLVKVPWNRCKLREQKRELVVLFPHTYTREL